MSATDLGGIASFLSAAVTTASELGAPDPAAPPAPAPVLLSRPGDGVGDPSGHNNFIGGHAPCHGSDGINLPPDVVGLPALNFGPQGIGPGTMNGVPYAAPVVAPHKKKD